VGADEPNEFARRARAFLTPYVTAADACVFSRRAYVWETLDAERAAAILGVIGLGGPQPGRAPTFARADGTPARAQRRAGSSRRPSCPPRSAAGRIS
jgi:hypothetical protein